MTDLEDEDAQMRRTKEGREELVRLYSNKDKEDKLDTIFRMQKYFADQLQSEGKFPYPREVAVDKLCQAMSHEVHELQNLTHWKWWKHTVKPFDTYEAREELIDIFHFVIHTALILGMTPQNFLDTYNQKMEINKKRQEQGY